MNTSLRILLAEDNPDDAELIRLELRRALKAEITRVDTREAMERALDEGGHDLVISDFRMPGFSVDEAFALVQARAPDLPFLVVSGTISQDEAIRLMDLGVRDFVRKEALSRLAPAIRRELRDAAIRRALIEQENATTVERARREHAEARAALAAELERANVGLSEALAELQETQAQLVQSAKMASLGQLIAGIAHEVNNPLAFSISHLDTIGRALETVARELAGSLPETAANALAKARTRIDDVQEGLGRVRDLVTKLRSFSRMEHGELQFTDLRPGIEATLTLLRHRIPNDVQVTVRFADDNRVCCAPSAVNQVVMNLLSNSLDAVGHSGEIRLETMNDGHTYSIDIADTGPGVPDAIRARIFEPFFTTKDVGAGTGLGLAICYRIIAHHKGTIEVGTAPDGGGLFTVRLPVGAENCETAAPAVPRPDPALAKGGIDA